MNENERVLSDYFVKEETNGIQSFVYELVALIKASKLSGLVQALILKHLDSFGPKLIGPNMFINLVKKSEDCLLGKILNEKSE